MKSYNQCSRCLAALAACLLTFFVSAPALAASPLHKALAEADLEAIENLLNSDNLEQQLSITDARGLSALDIALSETQALFAPELVRSLLDKGARPGSNNTDETLNLARLACMGGNEQAWQTALAVPDIDASMANGFSPFLWAAACNPDPAALTRLLERGSDPTQTLPPSLINPETAGPNAILLAAKTNPSPEVINALVRLGANLESLSPFGRTPLLEACCHNPNPAVAMALIEAGARVNVSDGVSTTPFTGAAANSTALPLLQALHARGADTLAVDDSGSNALHCAATRNRNPEVIRYLLGLGLPLNDAAHDTGMTPLMLAVRYNPNPEVIRLLIQAGADSTARDVEGLSAWENLPPKRVNWLEREGLLPSPVISENNPELAALEQKLLGRHLFSLQWISWEEFGTAEITRDAAGNLIVNARQALNGDEASLTGGITLVDAQTFIVNGLLQTKVSYINAGDICSRSGKFTFKATGNRKYWRMQEMENPCEGVVDYVDIYF